MISSIALILNYFLKILITDLHFITITYYINISLSGDFKRGMKNDASIFYANSKNTLLICDVNYIIQHGIKLGGRKLPEFLNYYWK